jgi:luciferase-like monooxygenase
VTDVSAFVDEIANELATWPGVRIGRRADGAAVVLYDDSELGLLYPDRGEVELPFLDPEHDELIEHGDAEPAESTSESSGVSHSLRGPSDVTEVLELFDRRYRDVRGEDDPYTSEDPGYK